MRKYLAFVLAVTMLFSLVACGGGEGSVSDLTPTASGEEQSNMPEGSVNSERPDEETSSNDTGSENDSSVTDDIISSADGDDGDAFVTTVGTGDSSTTSTNVSGGRGTTTYRPKTTIDKDGNVIILTTTATSTTKSSAGKTSSTKGKDSSISTTKTSSYYGEDDMDNPDYGYGVDDWGNPDYNPDYSEDPPKDSGKSSSTTTTTTTQKTTTTTTIRDITYTEGQPVTFNTALLFDEQHSSIDAQANTLRNQILNAASTVKASNSGTTYYVSYKGNDANDGLSPQTAWRSTDHVGAIAAQLKTNSTLLFERGGVYRGMMYVRTGMKIGAYGTGPKPQLYGSPQNYAKESLWKKTTTENVWRLNFGTEQGDVGNIIFNCGVKAASTGKRLDLAKVQKDYDFYYDAESGYVYLYLSLGNPGSLFKSIEIAAKGRTAVLRRYVPEGRSDNVTIDNLCIRYANFGISFGVCSNITITNCEIGWIGGCMQTATVRYGNGIEIYGNQSNITVKNNWIYQCYDAGYTNQGGTSHVNVNVSNNLIEYCHYNIEVFASDGGDGVKNSVYENNILRFPGYGFGSYNRTCNGQNRSVEQSGNIRTGTEGVPCNNFVIRNNIFDGGKINVIYCGALRGSKSPTFTGNTWVQTGGYDVLRYWDSGYMVEGGGSLTAMKDAVGYLEENATVIYE